ncbi:MAG: chemotaxis protein CheW [Pseudomonadales bacterium]|nr:chemotaxis protein CheW [Pseudomonadales bacterium]
MKYSAPEEAVNVDGTDNEYETVSDIVSDYLQTMLESAFSESEPELKLKPELELQPKLESKIALPKVVTQPIETSPVPKPSVELPVGLKTTGQSKALDQSKVTDKHGVSQSRVIQSPATPDVNTQNDPTPDQPALAPWEILELEWLLVTAGRLKLAFPLIGLDSVQAFDKKVTPFASNLDWLPGLTRVKNTNIRLVDIESYLMHEASDISTCGNVLVLNNSTWGLLVDSVVTTKKIAKSEMRCPTTTGRFSWRFGVLIDPVYTLIDPLRLSKALEHSLHKA